MEVITWREKYVNSRIYQFKNAEEIYSKYSNDFDIYRYLAMTELILFELINQILKEGDYQKESNFWAIDIIAGQMDEEAKELLSRHKEATKELDYIAEFVVKEV